MTFSGLKQMLEDAGHRCFKDEAPAHEAEYIVMSVYLPRRLAGDDGAPLWWWRCQLDCYSQDGAADLEGGAFESILDILDRSGCPFAVQSNGYDRDAAAMRMIVQCDVV